MLEGECSHCGPQLHLAVHELVVVRQRAVLRNDLLPLVGRGDTAGDDQAQAVVRDTRTHLLRQKKDIRKYLAEHVVGERVRQRGAGRKLSGHGEVLHAASRVRGVVQAVARLERRQ